jgi:hypothetical protein
MSDNNSTDHLEWLLITAAIVLVERCAGCSHDAAQEFLLIEISAQHIRYRYHGKLEFDGWVFPVSCFWWRNKFVLHEITASDAVIRTGAAVIPAEPDKDGNERYILDVQRSATVRMPLVQLHRDDIVRRLRERGFMSASDSTSAQQELPLPAPSPPPSSPPSSEAKQEESTLAQQPKHWRPSEAPRWLEEKVDQYPPPKERRKKSAWCRDRHEEMKKDFGDEIPWSDPDSLRRRLDDLLREHNNQPGKKV